MMGLSHAAQHARQRLHTRTLLAVVLSTRRWISGSNISLSKGISAFSGKCSPHTLQSNSLASVSLWNRTHHCPQSFLGILHMCSGLTGGGRGCPVVSSGMWRFIVCLVN